jgi:hypothetical protein
VKVQRQKITRADSSSAMSGNWSWSRQLASTRSLRPNPEFDRYLVTASSLMLAVVLIVGAAGYAGVDALLLSLSVTTTARAVPLEQFGQYTMPRNTSSLIICK